MSDEISATITATLRAGGSVFAEDEAILLLDNADSASQLDNWVGRRVTGEPLEYILGWAHFDGLRITVTSGVFVPRRRTEYLVERAAAQVRAGAVVVDTCCGSGAVAGALANRVSIGELHAIDLDPLAVACARTNLDGIGRVYCGDLLSPLPPRLRGHIGVLTANVPYVPSAEVSLLPAEARLYETRTALDGGPDGLTVARRLVNEATAWLCPGGTLLFETNDRQADTALALVTAAGLAGSATTSDDWGTTVVEASRVTR